MIGWYIHHQGGGHLARARSVAAASDEPVVALSSLRAPADPAPFAGWVTLADDPPVPDDDATAGGALHWAPVSSVGYRTRMAQLAGWVVTARPRLVVVDVSVEVSLLVRTLAVPVVVVALPGDRSDLPHEIGYRVAARIVAPWPRAILDPLHLTSFDAKVCHVGAISRFDACPPVAAPGARRVALLLGHGGHSVTAAELDAAVRATPEWTWTGLDGRIPSHAVWDHLSGADVVVTHAGLGALAETAAARRPAVLVPQARPYGEQTATADALARAGVAETLPAWPEPQAWPQILDRAVDLGGAGWSAWNDGHGAARFAAVLHQVAA